MKIVTKNKMAWIAVLFAMGVVVAVEPWGKSTKNVPQTAVSGCIADENVIIDLKKKQNELTQLKEALEKRENEIKAKETALSEEIKKLEDLKKQVAASELSNQERQEERVAKLVEAFEKMSPKSAAKILSEVSDEMAVIALSRLSTEKIAKVFGAMDSKRSSKLSEQMTLKKVAARTPSTNVE